MNKTLLTSARYDFMHGKHDLDLNTVEVVLAMFEREIGYPPPSLIDVTGDEMPIGPLPDPTSTAKVAICIGHARPNDSGAVSTQGTSEEVFNNKLARQLKDKLDSYGVDSEIIDYYEGNSYGSAMHWLAGHLQDNGFTLAIELHFNSYERTSRGYEYLYWHTSKVSDKVAAIFQKTHGEFFQEEYDRGVEPLGDQAHERGLLFCKLTHCPAIICEPFFGSNPDEVSRYMNPKGMDRLSSMYALALTRSI